VPWLLLTKPYLAWKEMHKTHGQGYMTIGHDGDMQPYTSGVSPEEEEEGNGQAVLEASEETGVGFYSVILRVFPFLKYSTGTS